MAVAPGDVQPLSCDCRKKMARRQGVEGVPSAYLTSHMHMLASRDWPMQRMATPPAKNTMYDQQQPAGEPGAWRTDTVCATNMGMHPAAAQGAWSTGICDCCAEPGGCGLCCLSSLPFSSGRRVLLRAILQINAKHISWTLFCMVIAVLRSDAEACARL